MQLWNKYSDQISRIRYEMRISVWNVNTGVVPAIGSNSTSVSMWMPSISSHRQSSKKSLRISWRTHRHCNYFLSESFFFDSKSLFYCDLIKRIHADLHVLSFNPSFVPFNAYFHRIVNNSLHSNQYSHVCKVISKTKYPIQDASEFQEKQPWNPEISFNTSSKDRG